MPVPVISIAQMRQWERDTWAAGQTETEVIRRVGRCVARHAARLTRLGDHILILAGKGHNGEDARCAREHLAERDVETLDLTNSPDDGPKLDAALASRPALVIDGLFGIGLNRPLGAEWVRLIESVNNSRLPVLAVDVPSGLNADTGERHGAAIRAAGTLTVGAPKTGLLRESAWPFVGRLVVAPDVGLVPCPDKSEVQWTLPEDFIGYPPPREVATHKGSYGHLAIVAGSFGYHGAAVLAARGAQRARPGLIKLHTLESVYHAVAPQLQAVMVASWQPGVKWVGDADGILLGPGLAAADMPDSMKMMTRHMWRDSTLPVVADASALDWLPLDPVPRNAVRVITPHPGEAARLLRTTSRQVQADRLKALRDISRRFGNTWVVLKGHQTLIGRSSGDVYVNSSGNPYLAQGGSGDVLAGYLAGLLVQPDLRADVLQTIRYAVWQHGATADHLQATRPNWDVGDLVEALGLQEPRDGREKSADNGQPSV
jgi:ADP-dependent NAD(P)H-hydrate dehydratase / NAD(P)H-hydrate epimerase